MYYSLEAIRKTHVYQSTRKQAKIAHGLNSREYLKELQKVFNTLELKFPDEDISFAFRWEDTSQGYDFWSRIYWARPKKKKTKPSCPKKQELTVMI